MDWFLYDNGLGHERVKIQLKIMGFSHYRVLIYGRMESRHFLPLQEKWFQAIT